MSSTTFEIVELHNYTGNGESFTVAANGLLDTVRIAFKPEVSNDTVVKLIDPVFGLELLTVQKSNWSLAPAIVKPRVVEHDSTGAIIPGSHTMHALSGQLVLVVIPAAGAPVEADAVATATFSVVGG